MSDFNLLILWLSIELVRSLNFDIPVLQATITRFTSRPFILIVYILMNIDNPIVSLVNLQVSPVLDVYFELTPVHRFHVLV